MSQPSISTAAAAARESARTSTGEFGEQPHSNPGQIGLAAEQSEFVRVAAELPEDFQPVYDDYDSKAFGDYYADAIAAELSGDENSPLLERWEQATSDTRWAAEQEAINEACERAGVVPVDLSDNDSEELRQMLQDSPHYYDAFNDNLKNTTAVFEVEQPALTVTSREDLQEAVREAGGNPLDPDTQSAVGRVFSAIERDGELGDVHEVSLLWNGSLGEAIEQAHRDDLSSRVPSAALRVGDYDIPIKNATVPAGAPIGFVSGEADWDGSGPRDAEALVDEFGFERGTEVREEGRPEGETTYKDGHRGVRTVTVSTLQDGTRRAVEALSYSQRTTTVDLAPDGTRSTRTVAHRAQRGGPVDVVDTKRENPDGSYYRRSITTRADGMTDSSLVEELGGTGTYTGTTVTALGTTTVTKGLDGTSSKVVTDRDGKGGSSEQRTRDSFTARRSHVGGQIMKVDAQVYDSGRMSVQSHVVRPDGSMLDTTARTAHLNVSAAGTVTGHIDETHWDLDGKATTTSRPFPTRYIDPDMDDRVQFLADLAEGPELRR